MKPYRKTCLSTFAGWLAVAICMPAIAQQSANLASPDQTGSAPAAQKTTATQTSSESAFATSDADLTDNKWHYYGMGYIWFPGITGTVGVRGFETSVHVTAGEIFSDFRGGLLGTFVPTYNRFSAPVDFMWMRLKDSKAIPLDPAYSVQALLTMRIVTPKVSYLLLNNPKIKIYATAGPRIWHLGTTLNLSPTIQGRNLYAGPNWIDFVAGGRFSLPLGSKASVDLLGDAGEGGATLDYQVAGFLNYQFKPKWALQGGWRYLTVHYGNNGTLMNASIQGIVIGATYKFK
jgi:opacity protein-like surface antigen